MIPNGQFCRGFWRDYPNMTSILKEIGCLAKTGTGNSLWLPVLRLCFCISDFVWIVLLFLSVVIFNPCAGTHSANSLVLPLVISPDFWLGIVFATGPFGHLQNGEQDMRMGQSWSHADKKNALSNYCKMLNQAFEGSILLLRSFEDPKNYEDDPFKSLPPNR